MPNNLSQFWLELKRRNVVRVITVYAASAFVILELVDILAPSLGLPGWTLNLVLILLTVGFIIAVILSWIYDMNPEGGMVKTERAKKAKEKIISKPSNSWRIATYISVIIIIGLIAYNIFGGKRVTRIDESLAKSIAVLPFQNFSEDQDQDFMCLGLTDEIINHLFRLESFEKVISLTTVLNFRGQDRNLTSIGNELGVNYILEGTYKKIGENLKVTAQLIEAGSDKHIWIQDYSRPYAKIMSVQSEIALQIAQQLNAYVSDEEQQQIEKNPTASQEAYELYQMGRFYWNKRTGEGYTKAVAYYEQAIETDPGYALAYAGLADTYELMGLQGHMDHREGRDKAEELAFKALELDGTLGEAYTVLGTLYDYSDWEWEKAENAFQQAMVLNPNYSTAHKYYAEHLTILGQHEKARVHMNRAIELDPFSFVVRYTSARFYFHQGHIEEALKELDICEEIQRGHPRIYSLRFYCYLQLGEEEKAYGNFRALQIQYPSFDTEIADQIFDEIGMKAVLEWDLENQINLAEEKQAKIFLGIAYSLAMLERYEEALPWLEKAFQAHQTVGIGFELFFKPLHGHPRFQAILEGMGLIEYYI